MLRRYRNGWKRPPPDGWEYIEPIMSALERELRQMVEDPHEGKRKKEALWPIHQINWQRTRFVYDMYYRFHRISRELYEWCLENKLADAKLISMWKKPGYERLCSVHAVDPKNFNFGTVSICRVPRQDLEPGKVVYFEFNGCRGCASGKSGYKNIFGNKYGQYLAEVQVRREELLQRREEQAREAAARAEREAAREGEGGEGEGEKEEEEEEEEQEAGARAAAPSAAAAAAADAPAAPADAPRRRRKPGRRREAAAASTTQLRPDEVWDMNAPMMDEGDNSEEEGPAVP